MLSTLWPNLQRANKAVNFFKKWGPISSDLVSHSATYSQIPKLLFCLTHVLHSETLPKAQKIMYLLYNQSYKHWLGYKMG